MAVEYTQAGKKILQLVKEIRNKHYEKFKKAKIIALMRSGKWDKWGTISRVGKMQRRAGIDADYILTLNGEAWPLMTEKQHRALIDHELYHMKKKKTKIGIAFVLRHHDVEEFIDIVKRYGDWTPNLKALHAVLKG
jgi:hypothetical protein